MSKVSYANMKLKVDQSVSTFDFNGNEIEVLNYLPIEDKYTLVMLTLKQAEEDGIYNPIKLQLCFHLNLVFMYTNVSFTDKQKENPTKLYDVLECNGFFDLLISTMRKSEYDFLFNMIQDTIKGITKYKTSASAVLQSVINDLPKNAEAAANIVNSFDKEKYQAVIDFAKSANGGREIN